jgi:hypothetical protein
MGCGITPEWLWRKPGCGPLAEIGHIDFSAKKID